MTLVFPRDRLNAFPKHLTPGYRSTVKRSPSKPLILVPQTLSELTGPVYGHDAVQESDNDLTKQHKGEPLGERIIVHGHVYDEDRRVSLGQPPQCVAAEPHPLLCVRALVPVSPRNADVFSGRLPLPVRS